MTADIAVQAALLLAVILLFATDRIRPDAVALGLILALMLTGQLAPAEALAGFGDPLVLMIAGLFVVGEALARTGVAHALGGSLLRRGGGGGETRLILSLMGVVALLSAFMSSTGAVAVFIPVVLTLSRRSGVPAARLLMPVAVASLCGGMLTLIGTPPNLVVSGELERLGLGGFGFFDFLPVGLVVLGAAMAWLALAGSRQLRSEATDEPVDEVPTLLDLARKYRQLDTTRSFSIEPSSPLTGRTPASLNLHEAHGITLVGVQRRHAFGRENLAPQSNLVLRAGDLLHLLGDGQAAERCAAEHGLRPAGRLRDHQAVMVRDLGLAEALVPPESPLSGRTARDWRLRSRRGLTMVAVRRRGELLPGDAAAISLAAGDTLLLSGAWSAIRNLPQHPRELLSLALPRELADVAFSRRHAPVAVAILLAMLTAMTFKLLPAVAAVLLAVLVLVASRCVTPNQAYRSIRWPSLVLIAGMLPMANALERSGAIALVVEGMVATLGALGPTAVMAGLFLLTAACSQFISNTATTVLVAPIAALAAAELGVSPRPLLMAVALAGSAAFLTPVASPVNALVMGPGGYRFADFFKVGLPLLLLTMAAALLLVPVVFPWR
jgi:di/tricarboxylate transporter